MARLSLIVLALAAYASVAAAANVTYTKSYGNFYAAVVATPDATYCKQIIDTLGLKNTMSNPALALTIFVPTDTAFKTLAAKLGVQPTKMSTNTALMRQVMYYHFVTGMGGIKKVLPTTGMVTGAKLDTMYISTTTKKAYQLAVGATTPKYQIKSVGTSAYITKPNIKCGAGVAHGIDNVLVPMALSAIPKLAR